MDAPNLAGGSPVDEKSFFTKKKSQDSNEFNARKLRLISQHIKNRFYDQVQNPSLKEQCLDEKCFFSMLAYNFPLHHVIVKMLRKQVSFVERNEIYHSNINTFYTQKIFPAYYNDRERIIAILNRYRKNADFLELIDWSNYQERSETFHFLHFLIGIISLDYYLEFYKEGSSSLEKYLETSIYYFKKSESRFSEESSDAVVRKLLSFSYYMNQDFDDSLKNLTPEDDTFIQLIKRVA